MKKIASWSIYISIILIVAAGFLNQKGLPWIRPFAGAILAIFAPISRSIRAVSSPNPHDPPVMIITLSLT